MIEIEECMTKRLEMRDLQDRISELKAELNEYIKRNYRNIYKLKNGTEYKIKEYLDEIHKLSKEYYRSKHEHNKLSKYLQKCPISAARKIEKIRIDRDKAIDLMNQIIVFLGTSNDKLDIEV